MLKGSAIGVSVVIALLIVTLCYLLLMKSSIFGLAQLKIRNDEIVQENLRSGLECLKSDDLLFNNTLRLSIFNLGDTIVLNRRNWGVFEVGTILSSFRRERDSLACLIGSQTENDSDRIGFYCPDRGYPLSISGETRLTGNSYVGKSGLKSVNVHGEIYSGEKLFFGSINTSSDVLPEIYDDIIHGIEELIDTAYREQNSQISKETRSFMQTTVVFSRSESWVLSDQFFWGNVILTSKHKIIVSKNCTLQDVIVIAPSIEIEEGFQGAAQFIATEELIIGKAVKLNYPSALVLLAQNKGSLIDIEDDFEGSGSILCYSSRAENVHDVYLHCSGKFKFVGDIYCKGVVQLEGEIVGTIYGESFGYRTKEATLKNVVMNLKVASPNLEDFFVGGVCGINRRNIVKWLN